MKFEILTVTMGREYYLKKLINSVVRNLGPEHEVIHHIAFNGYPLSGEMKEWMMNECKKVLTFLPEKSYNILVYQWQDKVAAGEANNRLIGEMNPESDLCIKADDDCEWVSSHYLDHAAEASKLFGMNAIISPFPVGLINNLAGPPAKDRFVLWGENTSTYYTFREVNHIGGFARISPMKWTKAYKWHNLSNGEDVDFSHFCQQQNIPMFYLENSLIVEHQESTMGQHERYEEYFHNK